MSKLYDSALKAAEIFKKAFCIRCFVVDAGKKDGFSKREEDPFCCVCAHEQLKRLHELKCENIHRDAISQAEKWGGKYEYQCPAGLTFMCSALQGGSEYGIIAGPFLMVELKDFITNDLERFFKGTAVRSLKSMSGKLPYYSGERVSNIAFILSMMSAYADERDSLEIRIMEQVAKNQSDVFYSLYDMKEAKQSDYPIAQEKLLQGYIAQGNKAESQRMLNEILERFCSAGQKAASIL